MGGVALLLIPPPYDFELSTERYRAFGPDLANLWHEGGLHRVVAGREVRVEAANGGVGAEPLDAESEPVVCKLLGLEFDLDSFAAFAATEPVLSRLVPALAGFRPPLAPDPFESLVTSITAQQVSLFAAFAIRNRLITAFGNRAEHAYAFPTRERLAVADEEVKAQLVSQRGLGEWTADWFLARHLARPQAWPWGDLGLRKAVAAFYGADENVRAIGARFAPFQNLTAHYLLTGLRVHPPGD